MRKEICVITTAHHASDVRIFAKEVSALAQVPKYKIFYAAHGLANNENIDFISLGVKPSNRILRFTKSFLAPFKVLKKTRAEIWHIHDPELIPFAITLKILGKVIIWDAHEDYFSQLDSKNPHREYIPKILRGFVKIGFKFLLRIMDIISDGVIAATPEIAKKYRNRNLCIVGNECILENFINCSPNYESKNILFIGSMSSQQSFRAVVDAIALLKDCKLVVAGESNDIEMRYASYKLGLRFEHLGQIQQEGIAKAISDSAIGLMTYFDSKLYETLNSPNKFYEFAASSLPILATPTRANIALIESAKCGHVVSGFDSLDISQGIDFMLSSKTQLYKWGMNGRNWATLNGNWNDSKIRLIEFYSKLSK